MMEWIGEERMGLQTWNTTDTMREALILAAITVSTQNSGGTVNDWIEPTIRDVRNIANIYHDRLKTNYAIGGQAFGNDELVQSDLNRCSTVVKGLR